MNTPLAASFATFIVIYLRSNGIPKKKIAESLTVASLELRLQGILIVVHPPVFKRLDRRGDFQTRSPDNAAARWFAIRQLFGDACYVQSAACTSLPFCRRVRPDARPVVSWVCRVSKLNDDEETVGSASVVPRFQLNLCSHGPSSYHLAASVSGRGVAC